MATPLQNLTAIVGGMLNSTPTNAQITKVASAMCASVLESDILLWVGTTRALLTNTQKAEVAVNAFEQYTRTQVSINADRQARADAQATIDAAALANRTL